jgi:hypothetical protein
MAVFYSWTDGVMIHGICMHAIHVVEIDPVVRHDASTINHLNEQGGARDKCLLGPGE